MDQVQYQSSVTQGNMLREIGGLSIDAGELAATANQRRMMNFETTKKDFDNGSSLNTNNNIFESSGLVSLQQ